MCPTTLLFYIDPTGGLPPSLWIGVLTGLLAALGAAWLMVKTFGLKAWGFVRVHYRALGLTAAVLVLGTFAAMRLFKDKSSPAGSATRGVVVLALDGFDPDLLERFMAAGRLPNFSRLARESGVRRLGTSNPPQSPVAWSSFITAKEPGSHGVFDFIKRDPATYALDLALADRQRLAVPWHGTPFWESPALARLGMTALRMPMAFPPPKLQGRMLAGMGVWDVRGTEGTYIYLSTAQPDLPEARGILLKLEGEESGLRGQLPGPYRAGQPDNVREPFVLDASKNPAILRLQDRSYTLHEGRWSDWIRVEFRMGPLGLQKVRAVTRMLLRRSLLDVNLYVSPLNFDPEAPFYPISHPAGYAADLVKAVGLYHTRGMPFDTTAANDGVLADDDFLEHCRIVDDESERMLAFELGRFEQGLLFGYFESPDVVQHMFWAGLEKPGGQEAIGRWYERMDALVGRVRSLLGSRGTLVVLSDHGFAPFHTSIHLNSVLRELGFLAVRGDEASSAQFFAGVDWARTRAYAVGFNSIYLNLQGREGKGAVARADAAATVSDLARRLELWTTSDGKRPILRAFPATEIYPATDRANAPELVVGYARGYRASWETALGAVPAATSEPNTGKWSGDHCIDPAQVPGIFVSTDPALRPARLSEVGPAIERYLAGNPP